MPDEPGQDAHGVPEQGAVGGVVDIGFDHRRIDAQLLAIFEAESHSGLHHALIQGLQRLGCEPVKSAVEGIVLGHRLAAEMRELTQRVSVGDPLAQFPIVPVLHAPENEGAEDLGCGQAASPGAGVLETSLEVLAYPLDQFGVVPDEVRYPLQDGIEPHPLAAELQVGEADLGVDGSWHAEPPGAVDSESSLRLSGISESIVQLSDISGKQNPRGAMMEGEARSQAGYRSPVSGRPCASHRGRWRRGSARSSRRSCPWAPACSRAF